MTAMPWRILRLFGREQERDGESQLLERQALGLPPEVTVPEPAPEAPRRPPMPSPQRLLQEQVATKLLHAWLQNRHQTLFPLALNLQSLEPAQRWLLLRAMVATASMTGTGPEALPPLLPSIGGGEAECAALEEAWNSPMSLPALLAELRQAALGAHAYTLALLVAGQDPVGRAWQDYLAASFALPADVTSDLQRRSGRRRLRPAAR
ncbi:hypothetical protein MHZ93_05790 [Roseomonas sp. ACRSG]|nr:hypothetical protein [Roseomonas sp. ACRSG]